MHCRTSLPQLPEDLLYAIAGHLAQKDRVRLFDFSETSQN